MVEMLVTAEKTVEIATQEVRSKVVTSWQRRSAEEIRGTLIGSAVWFLYIAWLQ
jgi:hypothetical protein